MFVTTFDVALGSWLGQHNSCIVAPTCGAALAMEHNGDVYSCDHYVEADHLVGNVRQIPPGALVKSEKQRRFGRAKFDTLPQYCRKCPVLFVCYGECPRNWFIKTPTGGLNYLCQGCKAFFKHIDKRCGAGQPPAAGTFRRRDHAGEGHRRSGATGANGQALIEASPTRQTNPQQRRQG